MWPMIAYAKPTQKFQIEFFIWKSNENVPSSAPIFSILKTFRIKGLFSGMESPRMFRNST